MMKGNISLRIIKILSKMLIAIVVALLVLQNTVIGKVTNEDQLLLTVASYNDDNPESTKYLVTDEMISNIAPNTTYAVFKENIEEGIEEYIPEAMLIDGKPRQQLQENDLVKTGLRMEYTPNTRNFETSVYGDPSKDGILNQVDLTQLIRHLVNADGWSLEEREGGVAENARMRSADMNYNKTLEETDITGMTDYIVFDRFYEKSCPKVVHDLP